MGTVLECKNKIRWDILLPCLGMNMKTERGKDRQTGVGGFYKTQGVYDQKIISLSIDQGELNMKKEKKKRK